MNPKSFVTVIVFACAASVQAGPRTSANYSIATDVADSGGRRAISANYTNDGSVGGIIGVSTVVTPAETVKAGYIGQLFETTGLTLTAATLTVNETTTDQLTAWLALDDATFLSVSATDVVWSVQNGPLTSINANGLATAGVVYQNTAATAKGVHAGFTGMLGLTVVNMLPDNFGTYGGDGLGDDWQVQHFGLNNANAAPALDPDGDGESNVFEFTAGLVPTNPASHFTVRIDAVPGQPNRRAIIFNPRLAGRTYTVESRSTLATGAWASLTNFTVSDNGNERTVTDLNATGGAKVYRVKIDMP